MKFNDRRSSATLTRPDAPAGALGTVGAAPDGTTHAGGTGYQRDARSELFLRAVSNLVGEKGFYETADENADRLRKLVRGLVVDEEGWTWVRGFLPWLRSEGNVRTASVLLAAEAVHARLGHLKKINEGRAPADIVIGTGNRELIVAVLQRPDEPGELIAYWDQRFGTRPRDPKTGRLVGAIKLPKPVKRGVADAVERLYNEGAFLRYDGEGKGLRFGDVLELTHAVGKVRANVSRVSAEVRDQVGRTWQDELFRWAITARQNRDGAEPPTSLPAVRARWELNRLTPSERHALARRAQGGDSEASGKLDQAMAGSWEWLTSWLGEGSTSR